MPESLEVPAPSPFVLLDDAAAHDRAPTARLYTGFVREHRCTDVHTLDAVWAAAKADAADGLHLVVLADYEWGVRLVGKATSDLALPDGGCLRLLAFDTLRTLSSDAVSPWLAEAEGSQQPGPAGLLQVRDSVTRSHYRDAIERVLAYIRSGDAYQVNHTYRLRGRAHGHPVGLYRRLRQRQPVAFGALMCLPAPQAGDPHWVLSCSPELFVEHHRGRLRARPMKGTAPRNADAAVDRAVRDALAVDVKNRAENLMIVDLLRNDLGRVAQVGSVRVPRLFDVEPYRTVHQMTSTVEADAAHGVDLPDILRALFPCGSVTGAPKVRALQIIGELEDSPRGLYTGAIGWVDASREPAGRSGRGLGDFCLSVAIRTVTLGAADVDGLRPAELGVGGGIVADSTPDAEWDETRVKARFLTTLDPGFGLFETLRVGTDGRAVRLQDHLARLTRSADALGFACDRMALEEQVQAAAAPLAGRGPHRLRLDLSSDGTARITTSPLRADPSPRAGPARVTCAAAPMPRHERALLAHKTTLRSTYDAAIAQAEREGAFDVLFFNDDGCLTEGARTNVFVKLDGRWWTPPLAAGVLPGVMRDRLLRRPGFAAERSITRAELARAGDVFVCNSLRGLRRVVITGLPRG